ncbi:GGDEF domain-containing protein [Paenibacillus sp. N3/727]|uniref:GGDEF domain-containing protein n=1 Tax=Paenibacillus sp. N3/727 TaxID=2925845 RepID=UPI001F536F01|nr:GGDEF domain-containing protein [Paenibacillus sp. N3/727]UNK18309.1 GGDEF domain-containing protein [Paenibacillus sp. N3/727]
MKNKTPIRRIELGYFLLIILVMVQELIIYWNMYLNQSFTWSDVLYSVATLAALLAGFLLPIGISTVGIFIFLVSYFVWLSTYAPVNVLTLSWILLIPANVIIAAFIRSVLIRSRRFIERLEALKTTNPEIDLETTLGNKDALADTLIKQSNLANRYADQYSFCMAMFKIEFLPLVQESLGSQRYAQLLLELSGTIQGQIRFEDYKFSLDKGRFIILCPLTKPEYLQNLTERIKLAMMDMAFTDKHGKPLKLVVRAGALVFQKEQFSKYGNIDAVIGALERNTETDLIGEYI